MFTPTEKFAQREAEVYVLIYEDDLKRVWGASPFIPGSLTLVYDKVQNTLQWFNEDNTAVHPPQPVSRGIPTIPSGPGDIADPLAVPGIQINQQIRVVPQVPTANDAQYFRQKSSRVQALPATIENVFSTGLQDATSSTPDSVISMASIATGGIAQADGTVIIPNASSITFGIGNSTNPFLLYNGNYAITVAYSPTGIITLAGDPTQASGVATFAGPGSSFNYPVSALPAVNPAQGWFVEFDFTSQNIVPPSGGFSVQITWNGAGVYEGDLLFAETPGMFITSSIDATIFQNTTIPGTLNIKLVSAYQSTEQLAIRQVRIVSKPTDTAEYSFTLNAADANTQSTVIFPSTATANIFGTEGRSDTFKFLVVVNIPDFPNASENPTFTLQRTDANASLVQIDGISIDLLTPVSPTIDFETFPQYRIKLLEQAVASVRDNYNVLLRQTSMKPEFRTITGTSGQTSALYYAESVNPASVPFTALANSTTLTVTGTPEISIGDQLLLSPGNRAPVLRTVKTVKISDNITVLTVNAILDANYSISGSLVTTTNAYTFSATGLPSGISIDPLTGIIGGAPTNAAPGDYAVTVTNSAGGESSFVYAVASGIGTDTQPYPFIWTSASTEAWMSFLQIRETRIRTIYGKNGNQAVGGTGPGQFPEIGINDNTWFYAPFDFSAYLNATLVITDSGGDHYRTIVAIDPTNSNVVQLNADYTFQANVDWSIPGAFRPPKAGDVGRQCLCPEGLQFQPGGYILANYDAYQSLPVQRAFQPWMLAANIYVADDDFLSEAPLLPYLYTVAPVIQNNVLLPFDSAIVRYTWTQFGGYDLDTRTYLENTGTPFDGVELGFFRPTSVPPGVGVAGAAGGLIGEVVGQVGVTNPPTGSDFYLYWGGDNVGPAAGLSDPPQNAYEACVINIQQFLQDNPGLTEFTVVFNAYWYASTNPMTGGFTTAGGPYTGEFQLQFETYLGGTYAHNPSSGNITNVGGTPVQNKSFTVQCLDALPDLPGGTGYTPDMEIIGVTVGHAVIDSRTKQAQVFVP